MDKNKLLYFIKDRGFNINDFCRAIDMSYASFYAKSRNNKFFLKEIWTIASVLKLGLEEINSIFFAEYVS